MPGQPLYDRDPTPIEVEQFRLLLSTYCDGSGASIKRVPWTVPDYRDFERVTAAVCEGDSGEDKGIFDVTVPVPGAKSYGISCKMAGPGLISDPTTAFMELSNSAKKFDDDFLSKGYDWVHNPSHAGAAAVELVMSWHNEVAHEIDLSRSPYLLLTHDTRWRHYKLSTFDLNLKLVDPWTDVYWEMRRHRQTGEPNSIVGTWVDYNGFEHRLWEFYPLSGGQLKYTPLWEWATWQTDWFELEQPPQHNLITKARQYFPDLWQD